MKKEMIRKIFAIKSNKTNCEHKRVKKNFPFGKNSRISYISSEVF